MTKRLVMNRGQYQAYTKLGIAPVKAEGQYIKFDDEIIDIESDTSGPWDNEPDSVMLEHAGYVCELKRHPVTGTWCGYVYVGEHHPLFKHVDEGDTYEYITVHGGITYKHEGKFGFDCNHAGDFSPRVGFYSNGSEVYRTVEFATDEVKNLAQQLRNYDTVYHGKMFDLAAKLDKRAKAIRKAMHKKG